MRAYQRLETHFRKRSLIGGAAEMLQWDRATMMPEGGADVRAEQLANLHLLAHELLTAPQVKSWLEEAQGDDSLDDWQKANLREMRRDWIHAIAVPPELVEKLTLKRAECEMVWRQARKDNNFPRLAPHLAEVVALTREVAQRKAEALGCSPYDALLDQYEPGGQSAQIDRLFDDLAAFLPPFLERVLARQALLPAPKRPKGPFPVTLQQQLGVQFMEVLGFDFEHGRLDTSAHPFCGGVPDDVRLTTRYDEADFLHGWMGVLHETGHALYERGLPIAWRNQPVGVARGMSLHESQSLLFEMQVCRSFPFAEFAGPVLQATFGQDDAWQANNLYRLITQVERGLIRVHADEVTYPAHVILRYRLEKQMIADNLAVRDLPEAWNAGMQQLLGITPPDDRDGCMQDIHWMDGSLGYFPTYTLGAMTAAQLFQAAVKAEPGIPGAIAQGNFRPLLSWLRQHVHQMASRYSTDELLTKATGEPLNARYFKQHLEQRYLPGA